MHPIGNIICLAGTFFITGKANIPQSIECTEDKDIHSLVPPEFSGSDDSTQQDSLLQFQNYNNIMTNSE
jgi:hypothetical protein